MAYETHNIITTWDGPADDAIQEELKESFPYLEAARLTIAGKEGIAAQLDQREIFSAWDMMEADRFPFPSYLDMFDYVYLAVREQLPEWSKRYPDKKFIYIYAECTAGVCFYEGYVVQNGEKIYVRDHKEDGHIDLLGQLFPGYNRYFFAPFTRDFFIKRG
mgnify:CR=1 FL=1